MIDLLSRQAEFLKWREVRQQSVSNAADDAGAAWELGIANEWSAELSDTREDIHTLNDGEPIHGRA